ncbi:MAG TPA: monovalent cation/H+ antiporter subunit D family protein [Hyphomonadaceae bacterium]|nr:monovalent cation/H+ antiporter subunit D family protein [Hyphomonadaceae bacterium]
MISFETLYAAPPDLLRHAPVLLVAGPLIGACAAALAPSSRWAWMISVGTTIFAVWMSLGVMGEVARKGVVDYYLGGFAPPAGIAFRIDGLGATMALLISFIGAAVALYSGHSLRAEIRNEKQTLFQSGFLLCVAGLLGLVSTGDAFNAFVFLEVSSIGTYALVALGSRRDRRALPAAFTYLVMGTIGATFFVIGIGFLYAATGTLNMADLALRLSPLSESRVVQAGFAFIMVGLGLKAAMFPLHGWLPGAYAFAPSVIAAFLSATATKAAIYLMARFAFTVFRPDDAFVHDFLLWILAPLGAVAAVVCSLQATFEKDVRRILAFSSVAQVGYILLGLSVGTVLGASAGLLHLLAHALMKGALFMAVGAATFAVNARTLADFAGAGRNAPWTMAAFTMAAASLMGVPLTLGFLSKWRLIEAALSQNQVWVVAVIAVSSLLALVYVSRMFEAVFLRTPPQGAPRMKEAPVGVLVPLLILAGLSVWLGIDASLPETLADAGARALFGGQR